MVASNTGLCQRPYGATAHVISGRVVQLLTYLALFSPAGPLHHMQGSTQQNGFSPLREQLVSELAAYEWLGQRQPHRPGTKNSRARAYSLYNDLNVVKQPGCTVLLGLAASGLGDCRPLGSSATLPADP